MERSCHLYGSENTWRGCRQLDASEGLPPALVLERALKVITHELCHAFGHQHCVHFNCVMQGMNHVEEYDVVFCDLCPVCLNKLIFMTGLDPLERYMKLKAYIDNLIADYGPAFDDVFGKWS